MRSAGTTLGKSDELRTIDALATKGSELDSEERERSVSDAFVRAALAFASATVGNSAPALDVPELDGQTFDLSAQRGKVVIVNFWATWCPPCREEMPALDAFYRRYHGQGLEMIGVSTDRPHDRSDVTKVMQSYSYPAAMLDDAKINDFGTP